MQVRLDERSDLNAHEDGEGVEHHEPERRGALRCVADGKEHHEAEEEYSHVADAAQDVGADVGAEGGEEEADGGNPKDLAEKACGGAAVEDADALTGVDGLHG